MHRYDVSSEMSLLTFTVGEVYPTDALSGAYVTKFKRSIYMPINFRVSFRLLSVHFSACNISKTAESSSTHIQEICYRVQGLLT
jgi:hypothetical protein